VIVVTFGDPADAERATRQQLRELVARRGIADLHDRRAELRFAVEESIHALERRVHAVEFGHGQLDRRRELGRALRDADRVRTDHEDAHVEQHVGREIGSVSGDICPRLDQDQVGRER
jgi:hypothetical protein